MEARSSTELLDGELACLGSTVAAFVKQQGHEWKHLTSFEGHNVVQRPTTQGLGFVNTTKYAWLITINVAEKRAMSRTIIRSGASQKYPSGGGAVSSRHGREERVKQKSFRRA